MGQCQGSRTRKDSSMIDDLSKLVKRLAILADRLIEIADLSIEELKKSS